MTNKDAPLKLGVEYSVCDDAETFCVTVAQRYELRLKADKYGGTRPGIFLVGMFVDVEKKFDKNKDGILTKDELPEGKASLYLGHMDKNENGQIDAGEISEFKEMFGNGKGFGRSKNDGAK